MSFLQQFKDKKVYLVSDSDLDGLMCSVLSEFYIKPISKTYIRCNNRDRALPDFNWYTAEKSDIVLFTDIAPVDIEMVNKIKKNSKLVIVDHHETHRELFGEMEDYHYSNEKSATMIFFELLTENLQVKKIVSQLAKLADTYDLYKTSDPLFRDAKGLHNCINSYVQWGLEKWQTETEKYQKFVNAQLKKIEKSETFYFTKREKEKALNEEKKEKKYYREVKKNLKIRTDNSGNKYAYIECFSKLSIVANWLLNDYPDVKYFACHSTFREVRYKEENGQLSLRSQKDFNVAKIAEAYGGGGHDNAAGVELPLEIFKDFRNEKIHLN